MSHISHFVVLDIDRTFIFYKFDFDDFPGCSVRLYGSSLSGFGLIGSDVNLDLQIPDSIRPDQALIAAFDIINSCPDFEWVPDRKLKMLLLEWTNV